MEREAEALAEYAKGLRMVSTIKEAFQPFREALLSLKEAGAAVRVKADPDCVYEGFPYLMDGKTPVRRGEVVRWWNEIRQRIIRDCHWLITVYGDQYLELSERIAFTLGEADILLLKKGVLGEEDLEDL